MRLLYTVAAGILVLMVAAPALGQSQITTGVIDGVIVDANGYQTTFTYSSTVVGTLAAVRAHPGVGAPTKTWAATDGIRQTASDRPTTSGV